MKKLFLSIICPLCILGGCSLLDPDSNLISSDTSGSNTEVPSGKESAEYYYYFSERVSLNEQRDKIFLQFKDHNSKIQFLSRLPSLSSLQLWTMDGKKDFSKKNVHNIVVLQSTVGDVSEDWIKSLKKEEGLISISYIMEHNGSFAAVINKFSIKLRSKDGLPEVEKLAIKYNCELGPCKEYDSDIYDIYVTLESEYNTLELASIFYESGSCGFTSPDFFYFDVLQSADTYYGYQWGVKNTGQYSTSDIDIKAEQAWAITEGSSNIVVAVMDDGVELTHPDLAVNIINGYDATTRSVGGGAVDDSDCHGTSVAGIIGAAKDNNIGISGVAPKCKIMPIRIFDDGDAVADNIIDAFNYAWQHGADVINCSWSANIVNTNLSNAIYNATSSGRNGKGCVVVFSAGNNLTGDYGDVKFPGTLSYVMAVGSMSYDGHRKVFSSPDGEPWSSLYGSTLDISAPGVNIPTTDRIGSIGYNDGFCSNNFMDSNYTKTFGMTSGSAPYVSGTAALILSKYPNLRQDQVRRAIELGASKVGGYIYGSDGNLPTGTRNNEVGYGLLNAYGALQQAAYFQAANQLDSIPAIDFTIINDSSYSLEEIYVELTGTIGGFSTTFVSADPGEIESGTSGGYPLYRGESITATSGSTISNITLNFYATTPDLDGAVRIGAAIDNSNPTYYYNHTFGEYGSTYTMSISNTTVPVNSRRRLYIRILDI